MCGGRKQSLYIAIIIVLIINFQIGKFESVQLSIDLGLIYAAGDMSFTLNWLYIKVHRNNITICV